MQDLFKHAALAETFKPFPRFAIIDCDVSIETIIATLGLADKVIDRVDLGKIDRSS